MQFEERALAFGCEQEQLFGIVTLPATPGPRAVLIVVGGPQYRAGSHRQFTLLARSLGARGIASLRFDYRGMGDSSGAARNFEQVDADLRAGVDQLLAAVPGSTEVVVWGLCDAASAALFYAAGDARVTGLVLANPWVRTTGGHAKATLKHYYVRRLLDPSFWKKLVSGRFNIASAGKSFGKLVGAAASASADGTDGATLPERMLAGATRFSGKMLFIISGNDLTAQEFTDVAEGTPGWRSVFASGRATRHRMAEADHTFSRRVWRDEVASTTATWVRSW
jgi:exosortase A-associated hydrolase 1